MSTKTSFPCGDSLEISAVKSLHSQLHKILQESSLIELEADAVEKADTAGLQLLVSFKAKIDSLGGTLVWKNPSAALLDSAKLLGLIDSLGMD